MATQDYSKFSKEKLEARQKSLEQMKGDDNVQKPPQVMAQLDDQIKQIKGLLKKFKSDTEKDAVKDVEAVGETIEKVAKQTSKTKTVKKTGKKRGRPKKKTYEITVDGKKFSFSDKAGKDNCQKAIALVKAQKDQQKESTKKYEAKSTSAKISNNLQTIAKQAVAKAKSRNVAPATLKKQVDAVEKAFKTLFNALETLMGAKISQAQRNAIMRILNDFEDKKTKTTRITKKEMGGKVDNWEDVDPDVLYAKGGNIRYNDGGGIDEYYAVEYYDRVGEHGETKSFSEFQPAFASAVDLTKELKKKGELGKDTTYVGVSGSGERFAVAYVHPDYLTGRISEGDFSSKKDYDAWMDVANRVATHKLPTMGRFPTSKAKGGSTYAEGGEVQEPKNSWDWQSFL